MENPHRLAGNHLVGLRLLQPLRMPSSEPIFKELEPPPVEAQGDRIAELSAIVNRMKPDFLNRPPSFKKASLLRGQQGGLQEADRDLQGLPFGGLSNPLGSLRRFENSAIILASAVRW